MSAECSENVTVCSSNEHRSRRNGICISINYPAQDSYKCHRKTLVSEKEEWEIQSEGGDDENGE